MEAVQDAVFVCTLCCQPFPRPTSLVAHMRTKHKASGTDVYPEELPLSTGLVRCTQNILPGVYYKCLNCHSYLQQPETVAAHIRITEDRTLSCRNVHPKGAKMGHNMLKILFNPNASEDDQKDILCPECGITLPDKPAFRKHRIKEHLEQVRKRNREYLCTDCGLKFPNLSSYKRHERSVHLKKSFVCDVCSFTTAWPKSLALHQTKHERPSPCPRLFICDVCGKNFMSKSNLQTHKRLHLPRKQKCPLCPKMFHRRSEVDLHMVTHTGEHPFFCEDCGQTFTRDYSLQVHRRIHTGEKPYKCTFCDAAFAQLNSLNVHLKKHSGERRLTI